MTDKVKTVNGCFFCYPILNLADTLEGLEPMEPAEFGGNHSVGVESELIFRGVPLRDFNTLLAIARGRLDKDATVNVLFDNRFIKFLKSTMMK